MDERARHDLANLLAAVSARAGLRRNQASRAPHPGVVLLVEDEPTLRGLVQDGLAQRGWTAVAAAHAEEALGLAAAYGGKVDAVVTDLSLPRMSGAAFVERLRRALPRLRVVYVSGHPPSAELRIGETARTAYLQKPFTLDELDGTLRALLATP